MSRYTGRVAAEEVRRPPSTDTCLINASDALKCAASRGGNEYRLASADALIAIGWALVAIARRPQ